MKENLEFTCSYGNKELEQVQNILFEMLLEIDILFKKNNIKYFLIYGTLLGAIRHKGFIPWDDDLDICVFKEDYEKAMEILRLNLPKNYIVHDKQTDPVYWSEFSKIRYLNSETTCSLWPEDNKLKFHGICLDIFRCWKEKRSVNYLKYKSNKNGIAFHLKNIIHLKSIKGVTKSIIGIIYRFSLWIYYYILNLLTIKKEKYWYDPDFLCAPIKENELFPLKEIEFNGRKFPVPNNPEAILERKYGDFMSFPKPENRIPHYNNVNFKK